MKSIKIKERRKNFGPRYLPPEVNRGVARWALSLIGALIITTMILTVIALFSTSANAQDAWTPGQKVAESAYLTLHTVDWLQTQWIVQHEPYYYESFNRILGSQPSKGTVNWWFGLTTIAQPVIANSLPTSWRNIWIGSGVVMEFNLTTNNKSMGIGVSVPW